jgi:hypothetical protein
MELKPMDQSAYRWELKQNHPITTEYRSVGKLDLLAPWAGKPMARRLGRRLMISAPLVMGGGRGWGRGRGRRG